MEFIIDFQNFNSQDIFFHEPVDNYLHENGKYVNISYLKNNVAKLDLLIRTPWMYTIFGLNKYELYKKNYSIVEFVV